MQRTSAITVSLHGRFRVEDAEGRDLTPRSSKSQAMLALLAASPKRERGRGWLQARLWSDRGEAQAAASLRQALSEVRRHFGDQSACLIADRSTVALDPARVAVEARGEGEFLEGLDARDEEFEAWLRAERAARAPTPRAEAPAVGASAGALPERPAILFLSAAGLAPELQLFADVFIDCIARSLSEAMTVDVHTAACRAVPDHAVAVLVQAFLKDGDRVGLRATLHDKGTQRLLWSGTRLCGHSHGLPADDVDLMHLGNQIIDALAEMLMLRARGDAARRDTNIMGRLALRRIFSMRADQLDEADRLLDTAYGMDPRGTFLAWRAQLRVIQHFERHRRDWPALREAADDYCVRALLAEPGNSMVLAAVANARLSIDRTPTTAIELARRGVQMNPASPLAWDSLAAGHMVAGDVAASHEVAARVQRLGAHMPNKFWWDMGLCITHTLSGRIEEAVRAAEVSHAFAPDFRPPLRYLVALYVTQGRIEAAQAAAEKLRRIEPDFTLDALLGDPDYPVQLLRRSGLLDAPRLRASGI